MSLYFFDSIENGNQTLDEIGCEVPSVAAAAKSAMITVAEIAKDAANSGEAQCLAVSVRADDGKLVTAHLSLWLQHHRENERKPELKLIEAGF